MTCRRRSGHAARTRLAAAALLFLAGCGVPGLDADWSESPMVEDRVALKMGPLADFLNLAASGEAARLRDPHSNQTIQVVAGDSYQAASGKRCRRFSALPPPGYADMTEGLACRDTSGRWTFSRIIVNPGDLAVPQ